MDENKAKEVYVFENSQLESNIDEDFTNHPIAPQELTHFLDFPASM